ncbi:MAG: pilus assembly protein PilY, partial [Polaromonas sp.]
MSHSISQKIASFIFFALYAMAAPSHAQYTSDIDIYSGTSGGAVPNVLLILDNSSNWNAALKEDCFYKENGVVSTVKPSKGQTKAGIEQCALYNVIDALPIGKNDTPNFNIGFMLFNETNVDAGARAIKAFTPLNAAGKTALKAVIRDLGLNQSPAPTSYALAMHEAYLYYTQGVPFSGQRAGTLPYDVNAFLGKNYTLPAGSSCSASYVIIIANGPPQGDYAKDDTVKSLLAGLGGNTTPITYTSGTIDPKDAANWTDEYARFLLGQSDTSRAISAKITTYTVAVTGASSDKATYPAIFNGIAKAGGGDFYEASDVSKLTIALGDIFSHLQAVDSVFSSASLPVSVNARGTYLNQVFMGMFRPDGEGKPRWRGNLKQYKFSYDPVTDSLYLSDASTPTKPAISGATGFISPTAVSFWSSASTFWTNQPLGTPASVSDSPDGEVVEKGGVAQRIRSTYSDDQSSRNVYTCLACAAGTGLATNQFNKLNTGIAAADLGLPAGATSTDRANLINWVRGTDNAGDEKGPGGTVTIRPSVHGDVLHSRPVVVNYGGSTGVMVFYGSNDGTLRAVNGNSDAAVDTNAGKELWSFIPQEHFGKLNRLRVNAPEVRLSTTSSASTALP